MNTSMKAPPSPAVSRRLLLCLALSVLLHALLFIGPQVDLRPLPDLKRLDVTLVRTAPQLAPAVAVAPAAAQPKARPPKPKAPPKTPEASISEKPLQAPEAPPETAMPAEPPPAPVEAPESVAAIEGAGEGAADEAVAAAETAQATNAPPDAPPAGQAWPRAGRISYLALMGEKKLPMGRATHQWEIAADGGYRLSELVEPATVAAIPWYRPGRKLRESSGRITASGLRPERFTEREDGRPGELSVELDWTAQQIRSAAGSGTLPDNAQDALSWLYQLGYPGVAAGGELPVTGGGALRGYRIEVIGDETVHLPFGEGWRTRHVRASYGNAREMTDVWLATEHFGLPVLIRTLDSKGVVYYLVATEVLVSGDTGQPAAR